MSFAGVQPAAGAGGVLRLDEPLCAAALDKAIKDQNWFIRSWEKNATVSNMLGTLKLIHRKVNEHNIDDLWMRLVDSATPSVTFAFLQMDESNGLDDDIYIKMNGRGRKLSVFENLKSWMDEKVSTRPYVEEWRTEMDKYYRKCIITVLE